MYRLNIAAFVTDEGTSNQLNLAMADISLVRSKLVTTEGGLKAAIAAYANHERTPELVVVQSDDEEEILQRDLETLAGYVASGTQVIVIGNVDRIQFYRNVIDLGVGQYLLTPLTAENFLRAIKDVFGSDRSAARGRIIAVVGSKGGVGASTVAHNLAWTLANHYNRPVSLVDLDLHFGTVGIDFNHDNRFGLKDAMTQASNGMELDDAFLERLSSKESDFLWLMASSPSMADTSKIMTPETLEAAIDGIARMSTFVVLDVPHVWTPAVQNALMMADEVLIVSDPTLQGLRNTQLLFESIGPGKPHGTYLKFLLNCVGLEVSIELGSKDFSEAVGATPVTSIPWAPLPFRTSSTQGRMVVENKKNQKIRDLFEGLAGNISGGATVAVLTNTKKKPPTGLAALFAKKSKAKPL